MISKLKFNSLIRYRTYLFSIVLSFLLINCSEKHASQNITTQKKVVSRKDSREVKSKKKTPTTAFIDSAYFYEGIHQYEKAIHYFKKAGDFYKRVNDWEGYIWTLNNLGYKYGLLYKADSSYYYLNIALKLALEKMPERNYILANIYFSFGSYYCNNYLPDKSIESYNKALRLWDNDSVYAYYCFNALGNFYLTDLKDYKKAEEYYIKALKIQESKSSSAQGNLADCYYNIGIANQRIGDYTKADSYLRRALDLYLSAKDYYNLERCFSAQGILQVDMGKYIEAIDNLSKALKLNIESYGNLVVRGYHLMNIAYAYLIKGQSLEAVKYYKKAIPLLGNNEVTSVLGLTDSYIYLGQAYKNLHNQDSTLRYFNKCLDVSRNFFGTKHPRVSDVYKSIGQYYEEHKRYDSALYYYQLAIVANVPGFEDRKITSNPRFDQIGSSSSIYEVLARKADVLMHKYYLDRSSKGNIFTAYLCYRLCDSLMIRHQQLLEYDNSKLRFTELCHNVYEKYLECLYDLYSVGKDARYISHALDVMEKNKAVLLQNALRQAEALNSVGIPDSIRKKIESLNKKIIYLDKSILEKNNISLKDTIQKQLFDARRSQEKLKEYIEKTYPVYSYYKYQSNQTDLKYIQSALKQEQQLIEYFQGDSSIYAIAVNKEKSIFYKFTHNQELDSIISTLRYTISTSPDFDNIERNYQLFTKSSYYLYRVSIAPLLGKNFSYQTSDNRQLIIIPDGVFSLIPFETLIDTLPKGKNSDFKVLQYLIKSFSVSYGYSANLLFNKIFSKRGKTSKVLAFSASGQSYLSVPNHLVKLSGTATELNEIKRSMDGVFYYDKEATEYNFKSQAPFYNIIHLALHGSADVKNSDNCKVFFTSGGKTNEDGILYDYELYALKLNASLAVLTACETGLGKYYKGEGIFSMARNFIYAGCPAVVMSYWKINDQITAKQIGDFYKFLKSDQSVNQALRNTKLEYLRQADNLTAHPANWASLNAWGKTDIQIAKKDNLVIYLFLGALLILIFLMLSPLRKVIFKKISQC